jgi:N-methylhydantoinase A/oxoprolinase/acetone carboxylase beta subunit
MRGVLIPVFPGALSALGILRANVVREFSQTMLLPVSNPERALRDSQNAIRRLQGSAETFLQSEGFTRSSQKYEYRLDIRYVGQAYHLRVPCDSDFVNEFHRAHERSYGHSDSRRAIEIVNVRCRATGVSPAIALPTLWGDRHDPANYLVSEKYDGVRGVWDITIAPDLYLRSDYYTNDERWEVTGRRGYARVNRCTGRGICGFGRGARTAGGSSR